MSWTNAAAVGLARAVYDSDTVPFGCFVALTGGCLYKDGVRKDADLLFYRKRDMSLDKKGLLKHLTKLGFTIVRDYGFVVKAYVGQNGDNLGVDLLFPDYHSGYYPPEDVEDERLP